MWLRGVLFLSLYLSQAVFSLEVSQQKPLVLRSADCEELQAYAKKFIQVLSGAYNNVTPEIPNCTQNKSFFLRNIYYTMDLSVLLPQVYKEGTEKARSICDGPNCLNNVLVSKGIDGLLNYTESEDMQKYVESPLCEKNDRAMLPRTGDVTVVKEIDSESETIVHAVSHLDNEFCFSKNGLYKRKPYAIYKCDDNFSNYKVKERCRGAASEGCKLYTETYRCKDFNSYYSSLPASLKSGVDCMTKGIVQLEKEVSKGLSNTASSCLPSNVLVKEAKALFEKAMKNYRMSSGDYLQWLVYKRADVLHSLSVQVRDKGTQH